MKYYSVFIVTILLFACKENTAQTDSQVADVAQEEEALQVPIIDPNGTTLETRINPPSGYERVPAEPSSYEQYLRDLKLKEHGEPALMYDGTPKNGQDYVFIAVVDQEIGTRDLHQCADAVMRIRAEYLWQTKQYDKIHFNFTNGFRCDYTKWMNGQRVSIKGNKTTWYNAGGPSNTYKDFWKYMELIFNYAGTLSLSKELLPKDVKDLAIGDVFIRGGSPGHAILVIDVAIDPETGEKLFLLAQSYMPAQQTQILVNHNKPIISPWYSEDFGSMLNTPEWTFESSQLMTFED
ncbi:MAG: DUF4846 domain-containing protein [Crocinitomicaceae bacterium]|nr:DUF4846 domain-containing protein [Crocinitomicaceae bacterium]